MSKKKNEVVEYNESDDFPELLKAYESAVTSLMSENPLAAKAILAQATIFLYVLRRISKELENIRLDFSNSMDEVAQDYAEYETAELKRHVDRSLEVYGRRLESLAEKVDKLSD